MASPHLYQTYQKGLLSTSFCPKCGRVGKKCSCYNGLLPAVGHALRMTGVPTTTFTDDDLLDIDNQEASSGSDLDIAAPMCEKSDQHDEFIEIEEFSLDCLPERIKHPSVIAWLWNCMSLVVRLNNTKNATGRVMLFPPKFGQTVECTNPRCPHIGLRGRGHAIYGGLAIITNKHVVQSNDEAKRTRVEFFFHDPEDRQLVVKEMGLELNSTNRAMDHTVFTITAHTRELIDVVTLLLEIANVAWRCVPRPVRDNSRLFALVISHPHGTAKKISIGNKIKTKVRNDSGEAMKNVILLRSIFNSCERTNGLARFAEYYRMVKDIPLSYTVTYYTAATCRGSSGAPVYMGNVIVENGLETNPPHTHRGKDPVEGLNVCFT